MEGNHRSETPPPSADVVCADKLNRTNSDSSTLTAANCEDILHRSANVKPDDSTTWTDEKHSLYLEHLEVSFVRQLHQSMGLLVQCSEQNKRDKNISQVRPINVHNVSEQCGCWENIDYKRGDPLSRVSAGSHNPLKSPWVYRFKRMGMHTTPASVDVSEFLTLRGIENHGEEGMGQNFVGEEIQNKSNTESRVKRLKTAVADTSSHDQIVPSKNYPTTDY